MTMKFLGKDPESSSGNSPTIWEDGDEIVIQGWRVVDAAQLTEIGTVPQGETVVRIPRRMLRFFPETTQ
jgi:hypothetical protein